MAATYILKEERDRRFALVAVQRAPLGMAVEIKKPKRSTEQNRRRWAMLAAIAGEPDSNSAPRWAGRTWDAEDWKDIQSHYLQQNAKNKEQSQADEIRKQLGL